MPRSPDYSPFVLFVLAFAFALVTTLTDCAAAKPACQVIKIALLLAMWACAMIWQAMATYLIVSESGSHCIVTARSARMAEKNWDREAEAGENEPRAPIKATVASKVEIRYAIDMGHDYR